MNLIDFLKNNKDARKIFGERELKIIEKQLVGINLTQSEKNRLSRDIRKKFNFIKEISRYTFNFEIKKGDVIKEIIRHATDVILKSKYSPRIKKIILFGSTVQNQRSYKSDIDIAVEFNSINKNEAAEFKIKTHVSDMVDIKVYNALPEKIKKEIDLQGKILYKNE